MLDRVRQLLANLKDLQQLVTMCVYVSRGDGGGEEKKKGLRSKIVQVGGLTFYLKV